MLRAELPDVIVLDLMMPEMDGFQLVAALQADPAWCRIPVVVVTALDLTPEDRQRLNGGVTEILSKHAFGPSELMARLAALLKGGAAVNQRPFSRAGRALSHQPGVTGTGRLAGAQRAIPEDPHRSLNAPRAHQVCNRDDRENPSMRRPDGIEKRAPVLFIVRVRSCHFGGNLLRFLK